MDHTFLKIGKRQGCLRSVLFNILLEFLANAKGKEKNLFSKEWKKKLFCFQKIQLPLYKI